MLQMWLERNATADTKRGSFDFCYHIYATYFCDLNKYETCSCTGLIYLSGQNYRKIREVQIRLPRIRLVTYNRDLLLLNDSQ
jgi:hypothetical protein